MADITPNKSKKSAQKPENTASQGDSQPSQTQEAAPPEKKMGRPTIYSESLADKICIKLSLGQSLRSICMEEGMPAQSQVYSWLLKYPDFQEKYVRAREEQAETHADEIVDISDETPETVPIIDRKTKKVIGIELSNAYISWQKNRIDARKWNAAKQRPKKYGDKVQIAGDPDSPMAVTADVSLFDAILKAMEAKRQVANEG